MTSGRDFVDPKSNAKGNSHLRNLSVAAIFDLFPASTCRLGYWMLFRNQSSHPTFEKIMSKMNNCFPEICATYDLPLNGQFWGFCSLQKYTSTKFQQMALHGITVLCLDLIHSSSGINKSPMPCIEREFDWFMNDP